VPPEQETDSGNLTLIGTLAGGKQPAVVVSDTREMLDDSRECPLGQTHLGQTIERAASQSTPLDQ